MPFSLLGPIAFLGQLLLAAWGVVLDAPLRAQIFVAVVMTLAAISFVGQFFGDGPEPVKYPTD
jgi:hypothetical protein